MTPCPTRLLPLAFVLALAAAGPAWAHDVGDQGATSLGWRLATGLPLALAGILYLSGVRRIWRRAGRGRGVSTAQALAFAAGWLVLAALILTPLHGWGRLRFTPHMIEHELLTVVAAPLLAAGRPGIPCLFALPQPWRRRIAHGLAGGLARCWRRLIHPAVAWALHAAALWLWHVPVLFEAALRSEPVHYLQHLTLFATAVLFWASLAPRRADAGARGTAMLSLLTTSLHAGLLGALLALSPTVWYASYAQAPGGLSPLEDQQLAGLIMWIPAGLVYVAAGLAACALWLAEGEARTRRSRAGPEAPPNGAGDGAARPAAAR